MGISRVELYVVLSDRCNFSCAHCLNSSGERLQKYRLSPEELDRLGRIISSDPRVEVVHFSGGEPTLELDLMTSLQGKITRRVKYSITTNGWLGSGIGKLFDSIQLDEVVVSYDKFHAPFLAAEKIGEVLKTSRSRAKRTILNYVYETPLDLAGASQFTVVDPAIEVRPLRLIKCGRQNSKATDIIDNEATARCCPSLDGTEGGLLKLHYIPTLGFTHCCGPLIFDSLRESKYLCSNDLTLSPLGEILDGRSFAIIAEEHGIDIRGVGVSSPCDICVNLFGEERQSKLPGLFRIQKFEEGSLQPVSGLVDDEYLKLLKQKYLLTYVYMGMPEKTKMDVSIIESEFFTDPNWSSQTEDEVFALIQKTSVHCYGAEIPLTHARRGSDKFKEYLAICDSKVVIRSKLREGVFGVLLLNRFDSNPYDKSQSLHIGFIGYDRNRVSREESLRLKDLLLDHLFRSKREGELLSATIDSFNVASLKFHERLGLMPRFIRLERRSG